MRICWLLPPSQGVARGQHWGQLQGLQRRQHWGQLQGLQRCGMRNGRPGGGRCLGTRRSSGGWLVHDHCACCCAFRPNPSPNRNCTRRSRSQSALPPHLRTGDSPHLTCTECLAELRGSGESPAVPSEAGLEWGGVLEEVGGASMTNGNPLSTYSQSLWHKTKELKQIAGEIDGLADFL